MQQRYTVFIGDPHGCLNELKELVDKIYSKYSNARIIITGDVSDRGPYSLETIRYIRENNIECIMGNHDRKILKWYNSKNTKADVYDKKDYYDKLSDEDIKFIMDMPLYIELDDVIAVHAGVKPGIPIEKQSKDDLLYLRYTDSDRRFVSLKKIAKIGKEKAQAKFWTEFGPFYSKNIVYGHQVHSLDNIRIDKFDDGTACYGIDTGCCFNGHLTALIWEIKEIIQVKAKKEYCKLYF